MTTTKTQPKPYQQQGIELMLDKFHGRALLADEVGLGKSLQALYAALQLRRKKPIVVVCPASVKYGWEEEVKVHTGLQSWVLEGRKPPHRTPLFTPPVIILNWDILQYWVTFLRLLKPQVVIADESHYIKSRKAARTKAIHQLCKGVQFLLCLTGTPIENRPAEFYTTLNLLRPDLFPSWYPFGNRYCEPKRTYWGVEYNGASHLDELRGILLDNVMLRRTRAEVLPELPPVTKHVVPLDIDMEQYNEAESDIIAWLHSQGKVTRGTLNAMALTRVGHLLRLVAELKFHGVVDWVRTFFETTDQKLTVFGYHRRFLQALHAEFAQQSVLVDGGVTGRKRQNAIDEFASNPRRRLFVGNVIAAGTGINKLQRVCHQVAIAELIWVPTKLSQAIGRLHRLGQQNNVTAHFLVARGTIEQSLCRALQQKQAVIDSIMEDGITEHEFDVLTPIIKALRRR